MSYIISHASAIDFWRMSAFNPKKFKAATKEDLLKSSLSKPKCAFLTNNQPIDKLVFNQNERRNNKSVTSHLYTGKIFEASFLKLNEEAYICSPAFALMQIALKTDFIYLVLLCLEFCGYFCYCKNVENTKVENRNKSNSKNRCGLQFKNRSFALCTTEKLKEITRLYKGYNGANCIQKVLKYCCNGATSIEMTKIIMLMCLPRRYGGYELNIESIDLKELESFLNAYDNLTPYILDTTNKLELIEVLARSTAKSCSKRLRITNSDFLNKQKILLNKLNEY
ncbi:MAG: hypothetical protein MJ189_04190 [Coriobacteriales bacterium]|nr:hypothetical protein [Coriobacteriales bacterium]